MYRFSTEEKREFWRKQQAERRAKIKKQAFRKMPKAKGTGALPGEEAAVKAYERGDMETFDRIAASK